MRLIDADKLNARLSRNGTPYYTVPDIENAPTVDVVPVVHTRWEMRRNSWYCVNCNKGYKITYGLLAASAYNYCPNCGAKMDEEGIK